MLEHAENQAEESTASNIRFDAGREIHSESLLASEKLNHRTVLSVLLIPGLIAVQLKECETDLTSQSGSHLIFHSVQRTANQ